MILGFLAYDFKLRLDQLNHTVTYTHITAIKPEGLRIADTPPQFNVKAWLIDKNTGEVKAYYETHNNLTTTGRDDFIIQTLFNTSLNPAKYIAIGNGTDNGDPHDNTALVNEIDRQLATFYVPQAGQAGLNATFTFTYPVNVTEAGVVNSASGGILVFYVNDWLLQCDPNTSLKISWIVTVSGN